MKYTIFPLLICVLFCTGLIFVIYGCVNPPTPKEEAPKEKTVTLNGTYTSTNTMGLYKSLTFAKFKNQKSVVLQSNILGIGVNTTYDQDENLIRINLENSSFILAEIISQDSIKLDDTYFVKKEAK